GPGCWRPPPASADRPLPTAPCARAGTATVPPDPPGGAPHRSGSPRHSPHRAVRLRERVRMWVDLVRRQWPPPVSELVRHPVEARKAVDAAVLVPEGHG